MHFRGSGVIVAGSVGAVAAVALWMSLASGADPGVCTTTKAVTASAVPALAQRFDVVGLDYRCRGRIGRVHSDAVTLLLAGRTAYRSGAVLTADVRARLAGAGWAPGPRPTLRAGDGRYTATVTAGSISPALATLTLQNTRPKRDSSIASVAGALPERSLTSAQKLRFATVHVWQPSFVPPGYAGWSRPNVAALDDVRVGLAGGTDGSPALRSETPPAVWPRSHCNSDKPDVAVNRCALWGTTKSGVKIYLAPNAETADGFAYTPTALIDGTLVSLQFGHNHIYVKPGIARGDVLRIFDSLQPRNTPAKRAL